MSQLLRRVARGLGAQWAGFLTIFLVLSFGTAYALPGSNTIFSDDIVDGQVSTADVADESLTGRDARTLANRDIAADALTAGQISESSLGAVPVADQAGSGRPGRGSCDESSTYVDCGSMPVDLARSGRVLIIAHVSTEPTLHVNYVWGPCRLEVNGAPIEASQTDFRYDAEGEKTPFGHTPEGAGQHVTLTAVTDVYSVSRLFPTRRLVVGVECALRAPGANAVGTVHGTVHPQVDISVVTLTGG
ncbi:hypothetical protein D0Z08_26020 [Nocardioides immobilis]|uniref:Uncharacterized protein n=1 Tax=Nocardioides immobilis TaxID=2049295 RepID=A0A417XUM1_9ACTN|nr:hypothetical protein [Nocardioides immobilis]RHW24179.1 hypothetical protein D0Z08_26020 [Nocardioides immobilis]